MEKRNRCLALTLWPFRLQQQSATSQLDLWWKRGCRCRPKVLNPLHLELKVVACCLAWALVMNSVPLHGQQVSLPYKAFPQCPVGPATLFIPKRTGGTSSGVKMLEKRRHGPRGFRSSPGFPSLAQKPGLDSHRNQSCVGAVGAAGGAKGVGDSKQKRLTQLPFSNRQVSHSVQTSVRGPLCPRSPNLSTTLHSQEGERGRGLKYPP